MKKNHWGKSLSKKQMGKSSKDSWSQNANLKALRSGIREQ